MTSAIDRRLMALERVEEDAGQTVLLAIGPSEDPGVTAHRVAAVERPGRNVLLIRTGVPRATP